MRTTAALLILCVGAATAAADTYWWKFEKTDCGYDDVSPQPACGAQHKGDVDNLKACCAATKGCGGFNTNGIIKKTDCLSHKSSQPACDLYVLEDHPEPPPTPPPPTPPPPTPSQCSGTTSPLCEKYPEEGCSTSSDLSAAECSAWIDLFDQAGGTGWYLAEWGGQSRPVCQNRLDPCACFYDDGGEYEGVMCQNSNITHIDLPVYGMCGSLPATLANLGGLISLKIFPTTRYVRDCPGLNGSVVPELPWKQYDTCELRAGDWPDPHGPFIHFGCPLPPDIDQCTLGPRACV